MTYGDASAYADRTVAAFSDVRRHLDRHHFRGVVTIMGRQSHNFRGVVTIMGARATTSGEL